MLMAAHTSNSGLSGGAGDRFDGCFEDFDDGSDVYIDMDSFYQILKDEPPDPSQGNLLCQSTEIAHEVGSSAAGGDCDKSMCQNDTSCIPPTNELNLPFSGEISSETINETSEGFIKNPCTSPAEISLIDINKVSACGNCSESGVSHVNEIAYIDMDSYASMVQSWTEDHGTDGFMTQTLPTSVEMLNSENNEMDNLQPVFSYLDQIALPETKLQSMDQSISDVPISGYHSQNADVQDFESGYYANLVGIDFFSGSSTSNIDTVPEQFMLQNQVIKHETGGEYCLTNAMNYRLLKEVEYKDFNQKTSVAFADGHLVEDMLTMFPGNQSLVVAKTEENEVVLSNRSYPSLDLNDKWMPLSLGPAVNSFPVYQGLDSQDPNSVKNEPNAEFGPVIVKSTSFRPEGCQVSSPKCGGDADDDLCILEDISHPGQMVPSLSPQSYTKTLNQLTPRTPEIGVSVGATRLKPHDERSIFRAALQDLSQPTLESNPPDGSLAVPLLRHQRIALHWMVQKETTGMPCSGGILADDQGLGKTISTIALILTEKPSSERIPIDMGKVELETLDVDEDDQLSKSDMLKKNSINLLRGGNQMKSKDVFSLSKGRPAAGTLIVCPTSVMRQWAEELRNKVTSEANVSVLVYHGSHRTKDPDELAKYDVVVTTYSIVSMEVPKQSFKEKEDGERNLVSDSVHLSSSKKRKHPTGSDRKRSKRGMGDLLPESTALPLARVRWFRVVLDEAQSIKNYKTRVAQACWGLRAKRRWCLSGTPIQNAVDDLYSYFRFLKYDPFDVYQFFCSHIKAPIGRSPSKGYKKLQAILKSVMLRRTKGMLLDGQPIISLPPKSIELMRVEFSEEERAFYAKLEADSRAEFQNYAANGTVKQNYVNILLLLLRLRQACDHPRLVHRYDLSDVWESSLSEANKFSLEKLHSLLCCLEASLAICGRCNDAPEDAVVSVCGHVFCNQCISEHLSGDNNHCPASNCRVQLSSSSVFSGAVLTHCLSAQTSEVTNSSPSVSHQSPNLRQTADPLGGRLLDSAKINTALEILKSLSKPQDCMAKTCFTEHYDSGPSSSDSSQSRGDITDSSDVKIPDSNAEANTSTVSVVNEKAIVFSQWTRMLDLLEDGLKKSTIQYRRLDGTMSVAARDKAVRDFNMLPEVTVMIMSLKAASLGLNMVAACHVLLLDPWWNPTTEDQAIDRAHRIGQTRPVTVYRLTVKDTVEDRILALQQKKREMVASAFGADETGSRQTRLTVDDLNYLFMV